MPKIIHAPNGFKGFLLAFHRYGRLIRKAIERYIMMRFALAAMHWTVHRNTCSLLRAE